MFLLGFTTIINAQEKKKIEIKYAGRLNVDEENYPGARILTRDESQQVHIGHESIDLWCDRAIHYGQENFIEAYGNVRMKQADTVNMTSKYIEYSGITQLALARGEVVLTDPNTTVSSDTLYFDRLKQEAFYRSGGTVVKDSTVTITSKIGRHYMEESKFKFVEDVVMVNDSSTIKSNYFDYYSETGYAYLFGPSTITTPESETYCEKGFYDTENEVGYVLKNARIDYNDRIIEGDSLYMDNVKNFATASNNIKVTDTINHSIIKGHYAEVFRSEEKDSVFITKKALAITVQEKDSVYIHADKIMVTGKPDHRIVRAYYDAKIYKSDLSGKADSIHSNQKTGITELINLNKFGSSDRFSTARKPIMWNIENQMTGDTIHLISNPETEKIDSLLVFENAFIISLDTVSKTGYNQINGKHLRGIFNDENQLRQVDINQNAQSIFYTRNEEQELIGIDKAKSGSISILFDQGAIEEYTRYNQADATLTPESQFPERDKILKGFDWREEERIASVEDLFKGDPPLELPIIQGLADYIPPKDFFDPDLIERINQAGSRASENIDLQNFKHVEATPIAKNLLKSGNNLASNHWLKVEIATVKIKDKAPDKNDLNFYFSSKTKKNGFVFQPIDYTNGKFQFTIWLKGKGDIEIALQEQGGNYTSYALEKVKLNMSWKKYTLTCIKETDNNRIRALINKIDKEDNVYAWGSQIIQIPSK